jgi:hypothetical protein
MCLPTDYCFSELVLKRNLADSVGLGRNRTSPSLTHLLVRSHERTQVRSHSLFSSHILFFSQIAINIDNDRYLLSYQKII